MTTLKSRCLFRARQLLSSADLGVGERRRVLADIVPDLIESLSKVAMSEDCGADTEFTSPSFVNMLAELSAQVSLRTLFVHAGTFAGDLSVVRDVEELYVAGPVRSSRTLKNLARSPRMIALYEVENNEVVGDFLRFNSSLTATLWMTFEIHQRISLPRLRCFRRLTELRILIRGVHFLHFDAGFNLPFLRSLTVKGLGTRRLLHALVASSRETLEELSYKSEFDPDLPLETLDCLTSIVDQSVFVGHGVGSQEEETRAELIFSKLNAHRHPKFVRCKIHRTKSPQPRFTRYEALFIERHGGTLVDHCFDALVTDMPEIISLTPRCASLELIMLGDDFADISRHLRTSLLRKLKISIRNQAIRDIVVHSEALERLHVDIWFFCYEHPIEDGFFADNFAACPRLSRIRVTTNTTAIEKFREGSDDGPKLQPKPR